MTEPTAFQLGDLRLFVVQLGAAMNAAGEPVHTVQERLTRVAAAYDARFTRISVFPTFLMVTMGRGEPATFELTSVTDSPRLDQIAELERLVQQAEHGAIAPADGLRRLEEISQMAARYGNGQSVAGYAVFTLGLCLILNPAPREVAAAAVLGGIVGLLRSVGRNEPNVRVLLPLIAASVVSALSALGVRHDVIEPGLRAMVASLVVFLPGTSLTTAVLELAAGQTVSGASRLVSGVMQLALLAFGIIAGVGAAGMPSSVVFADSGEVLGDWAPSVGVLVFAVGVLVANSAPTRAFPGLLIVLYSAWAGQLLGNEIFGGYVSAFVGALVMTPVAFWVSRLPSAMPPHASFLPGFWLLVPGALGLIGLAQLAGDADVAGTQDLVATVVSIFAVAVGVLVGTLLLSWRTATGRVVVGISESLAQPRQRWRRRREAPVERDRAG